METEDGELIVVALGGNAILRSGGSGTFDEQYANAQKMARQLADLAARGCRLAVTHGNGPQVGAALLRHKAGEKTYRVPGLSMDVCVAETQGFMGYVIEHALRSELRRRGLREDVVTVITQVAVSRDDPAFDKPSKPVGPFYTEEEMRNIRLNHPEFKFVEDRQRGGWRRIVPSPEPLAILELDAIRRLVDAGYMVIAAGGGGIPVFLSDGYATKVEVVIDKDLTGQLLATGLGASRFFSLTDVEAAYLHFGTAKQTRLSVLDVELARRYLEEGQFGEGSMAPKVLACVRFIENGGEEAAIAANLQLLEAFEGRAGTHIKPASR